MTAAAMVDLSLCPLHLNTFVTQFVHHTWLDSDIHHVWAQEIDKTEAPRCLGLKI